MIADHTPEGYKQEYLTDPANRGMLVLETFNGYGEKETKNGCTILQIIRKEKEKILDKQRHNNRTIAYRFKVNPTNEKLLTHLVTVNNLTVQQDFSPPFRAGKEKFVRYRWGLINASILNSGQVDKLIAEFNTGREFFLMKQTDQQGKDPDKTYFSTEMRKFSKQDEGRAALIALVLAEHQGCITFWPVAGSLNKFWGVIDKKLSTEQVTNILNKVNKIQTGDKSGPLKTYLSFAMKGLPHRWKKRGGATRPYNMLLQQDGLTLRP